MDAVLAQLVRAGIIIEDDDDATVGELGRNQVRCSISRLALRGFRVLMDMNSPFPHNIVLFPHDLHVDGDTYKPLPMALVSKDKVDIDRSYIESHLTCDEDKCQNGYTPINFRDKRFRPGSLFSKGGRF